MWHISNIHILYISIITYKSFEQSNAFSKSYNYIMRNLVFNKILSWNQSSSFLSGYSNLCCSMLSSSQVLLNEFNLAKNSHFSISPLRWKCSFLQWKRGKMVNIYIIYPCLQQYRSYLKSIPRVALRDCSGARFKIPGNSWTTIPPLNLLPPTLI